MNLHPFIQDIPDFPKPGIVFKDISPLLLDADALQSTVQQLLDIIPSAGSIDKVVGIESRGFIMGSILAEKLQTGFVPVRKKGKLPGKVLSEKYNLEYGESVLEIQEQAIQKGDRILLHDDVLATGGTAKAACNLIEQLGGTVVQCNFLIELLFLKGRSGIEAPIATLMTY